MVVCASSRYRYIYIVYTYNIIIAVCVCVVVVLVLRKKLIKSASFIIQIEFYYNNNNNSVYTRVVRNVDILLLYYTRVYTILYIRMYCYYFFNISAGDSYFI